MPLTVAMRQQRRRLMRFSLDRQLKPLITFNRRPRVDDADGNGLVLAFVHGAWCAEAWRFVAEHPTAAAYWMPLSALPVPDTSHREPTSTFDLAHEGQILKE